MAQKNKKYGFTIAEMLVALAVMAMLLTAVAVAFNASAINYNENKDMFNAINMGRQAMLRMTSQLRTAEAVSMWSNESFTDRCSFTPADSNLPFSSQFRFYNTAHSTHPANTVCINSGGNHYLLCDHVTSMTFTRSPTTGTVKSVQMSMTITVGNSSQAITSAVVLRKTL